MTRITDDRLAYMVDCGGNIKFEPAEIAILAAELLARRAGDKHSTFNSQQLIAKNELPPDLSARLKDLISNHATELLTHQTDQLDICEQFARRVLGDERYNNSPVQAHPLELVEAYVAELENLRIRIKNAMSAIT